VENIVEVWLFEKTPVMNCGLVQAEIGEKVLPNSSEKIVVCTTDLKPIIE
jgi:hypothetical protein